MSKSVLISIHPEWCEKISSGQKTIEVRKTRPKIDTPFKCYIYQTKYRCRFGKYALADRLESAFGMVIGEFVCDKVYDCDADSEGLFDKTTRARLPESCLDWKTIYLYTGGFLPLYGWHISDLVIYDKPKKLSEFMTKPCDFAASCGACVHSRWDEKVDYHQFIGCSFDLQRPPQSWCYVEEI